MNKTKANKAIAKAYGILHTTIDDMGDLKRYKLYTVANYHAACSILEELRYYNPTETFIEDVANFFRDCGFKVEQGIVNYSISF